VERVAATGAKVVDRLLIVGAALLLLGSAWWGWAGVLPGAGLRASTTLAALSLLMGGFALGRDTRLALSLLQAALWASLALGVIGIFSIGLVYIVASILIGLAIVATPHRSELPSRYDGWYVLLEAIVFMIIFGTLVVWPVSALTVP
jgi:hypothetical protein